MTDTTLIYPGGDVKALGEGKVGGYLVRFGTPETADIQGDYFTVDTDYGLDTATKARVVYHHGLGKIDDLAPRIKNTRIGTVDLTTRDDGLWAEGTLDISRPEVKAVYDRVEDGKLGWSSGSVDRLVIRESVNGKACIKSWPIIEASLSPRPVDPRNKAVAMKALTDESSEGPVSGTLAAKADALVSSAEALIVEFANVADLHPLRAAKREAIKSLCEGLDRLYTATAPRLGDEQREALRRRLLASRI